MTHRTERAHARVGRRRLIVLLPLLIFLALVRCF